MRTFLNPVYLAPTVLNRKVTCGGITIEKKEEIFIEYLFSQEKETQTELTSEEIRGLEERLKELEIKSADLEKLKNIWRDKFLAEKENNGQEFQGQITELTQERDNIQWKLNNQQTKVNNLRNEIKQLNNNLTINQQEKDRIKNDLQNKLNQSQNERDNLQNQVNQLNDQINNLNQRLANLIGERDDYQNKWDEAEEELRQKQEIIRGYLQKIEELESEKEQRSNEIIRLRDRMEELAMEIENVKGERDNALAERNVRPNIRITLEQWNNDYKKRPTQQQLTQIQNQLTSTQQQLNNLKTELDKEKIWWNKWVNDDEEKIIWLERNPYNRDLIHLEIANSTNIYGHESRDRFDESDFKYNRNRTSKKMKETIREYIDLVRRKYK